MLQIWLVIDFKLRTYVVWWRCGMSLIISTRVFRKWRRNRQIYCETSVPLRTRTRLRIHQSTIEDKNKTTYFTGILWWPRILLVFLWIKGWDPSYVRNRYETDSPLNLFDRVVNAFSLSQYKYVSMVLLRARVGCPSDYLNDSKATWLEGRDRTFSKKGKTRGKHTPTIIPSKGLLNSTYQSSKPVRYFHWNALDDGI